ncbi:glycosyltransferase [Microbacterium sp. 22242]|uniref:glycosyltransferase n=1 Tax=Microbacterium sp. 22242 TaxID=3453896 RepID=UPI003F8688EA
MDPSPSSSAESRAKVVSVTKYLPHPGIAHAGGAYALQHYRAIGNRMSLTALAPNTELNRASVERGVEVPHALLTSPAPFARDRLKAAADAESLLRGSTAHRWFEHALVRSSRATDLLRQADVIEFQWSEMASLIPAVRRIAPNASLVVVAHDVITQRWRRAANTAANPLLRLAYRGAAALSARREAKSFSAADRVLVFSEKDARLVLSLAPDALPEVVYPGFPVPPARTNAPKQSPPSVVFSGAMARPDNDEAARWFLEAIWPLIRQKEPTATFTIVGAAPSAALTRLADTDPQVAVTGYVDSLDPFLSSADVMVIPLRNGAGVKFKTIDALLRGVPAVATSVGAEGIDRQDLLLAVTDDPTRFADAVVEGLRANDLAAADAARVWAASVYGLDAFRDRITNLYEQLAEGAR